MCYGGLWPGGRSDSILEKNMGNFKVAIKGTTYVFPKLDGTNAQVWLGEDDY